MYDLDFAYAQARIQARFAALPRETDWQRVAVSRTLAAFLEDARTGSLRDWVKGFSVQSDVHDLEAGIGSLYRETLEAVTALAPVPWREAVSWLRWLPLLPLLAHLQAGGMMPKWANGDPFLRALLDDEGALSRQRLEGEGAQCLLQPGQDLPVAWVEEWRRRWPPCSLAASRALTALRDLLLDHVQGFSKVPAESAWRLRRELRERLRLRFHQQLLQPTIPFIYLALTALDLERLRAALVTRILFSLQDDPMSSETAGRFAA
jgi:hypothetical protein